MDLKRGSFVSIHAYKHNGNLYRTWEKCTVYENNNDNLILINEDVTVTEESGRKWKTNEPAIWFFSKKDWYNTIAMFKENGLNYYSNLASPYVIENKTIKYIDYDLDVKVFNDYSYKILDLREFNRNRLEWNYPRVIVEDIWKNVDIIKDLIKNKSKMFDHDYVWSIWNDYKSKK